MAARIENNGKISVQLKQDEICAVQLAIRSALYLEADQLDTWLYCLLTETLEEMTGVTDEISLRKSAFFAVFSPMVMKYIDVPTQILLRSRISLSMDVKREVVLEDGKVLLKPY